MLRIIRLVGALVMFVCLAAPASAAGPALQVLTPKSKTTITSGRVTVTFKVTDLKIVPSAVTLAEYGKRPDANRAGEGHVHLRLDLQPIVVWYSDQPYTFADVPPGPHQLMVELVNNDHSSLSTPVMKMIQFDIAAPDSLPRTGGEQPASGALVLLGLGLLAAGALGRRYSTRAGSH